MGSRVKVGRGKEVWELGMEFCEVKQEMSS